MIGEGDCGAVGGMKIPPREGAPVPRWIGSCVGLRAGLDAVEKRSISYIQMAILTG
jgi:hypothetical protein